MAEDPIEETTATPEPHIVTSYKQIGTVRYVLVTLPIEVEDTDGNLLDLDGPLLEGAREYITYRVRGMTRSETLRMQQLLALVEEPEPPMRERPVMPLDSNRLSVANISKEQYPDYQDPTYLEQRKIYEEELKVAIQRSTVYNLVTCVQGFDLSDEEIRQELEGEEPEPREPVASYSKRLDQISRIVLPTMDQRHYMALQKKIAVLSGVNPDDINFM